MNLSLGSVRKSGSASYFGLLIGGVVGLLNLGLGHRLCAAHLVMAGWCAPLSRCMCHLTYMPISAPVALTVSLECILALPSYHIMNAELCYYKKKKKSEYMVLLS